MTEREALQSMLWIFAISFAMKSIVFDVLAAVMFRQQSKTAVGRALKWHYLSIGVQAILLVILYIHYAKALDGEEFLTFRQRMAVYAAATASVCWVVLSGLILLFAYWKSRGTGDTQPRERSPT